MSSYLHVLLCFLILFFSVMDVDDEFIMEPRMVLVRAVYRDIPQYINRQINNDSRPSSLQINYLDSTYMRGYSNVHLLSCQGTKFELNSAQLAAASKLLHKLLLENEKYGEGCLYPNCILP